MTEQDRRGWIIIGALFVSIALAYGTVGMTLPALFMTLLHHFRVTRANLSGLMALQGIAAAISAPAVGWLLDRVEARLVMAFGAVITGTALLMASRSGTFFGLQISYAVMGLGATAAAMVPGPFVAANWFPDERKGFALGCTMLGLSVGGAVINPLAFLLNIHFGWRACFALLGLGLIAIMVPLVLLIVRSRPQTLESAAPGKSPPAAELPGLEVSEGVRGRSLYLIAAIQFLYTCTLFGTYLHLVPYLMGQGFAAAVATGVLSIQVFIAGAGKLGMGWMADRLTGRLTLLVNALINATGYLLLFGARHYPVLALFVLLYGFTVAAPMALTPMLVIESLGLKRYGSFLGLTSAMSWIGGAFGPWVTGKIFDMTGSYNDAILLFIAMQLLIGLAAVGCIPLGAVVKSPLTAASTSEAVG